MFYEMGNNFEAIRGNLQKLKRTDNNIGQKREGQQRDDTKFYNSGEHLKNVAWQDMDDNIVKGITTQIVAEQMQFHQRADS